MSYCQFFGHNLWDELLAKEFREHATGRKGGSQVFITIHQPCCVDALEPEDVWILEKAQEGFSTIRRASDYAIIRDMVEVDIDEEPKMVQDPSIMSGDRSKKSNRIDFLLYYFLDN